MTLSTDILIHGPIDQEEVYAKVNDILEIPAARKVRDVIEGGVRDLSNVLGQGFPAIVDTRARIDGQPIEPEGHETGEWACEADCDYWRHVAPAYHVGVDLDTAYAGTSHIAGRDMDCNSLHAYVIVELVKWLSERGLTLHWVNEYSGQVNYMLDGLAEFIGDGDQAQGWFHNLAMPAIAAHIESSGS